jgi:hypothetical protein
MSPSGQFFAGRKAALEHMETSQVGFITQIPVPAFPVEYKISTGTGHHCCGSESGLDSNSRRILDPDLDSGK